MKTLSANIQQSREQHMRICRIFFQQQAQQIIQVQEKACQAETPVIIMSAVKMLPKMT